MHYEIDNDNYITKVFFGCTSDISVEYTGTIPDGYTDLMEWMENEDIRAWYISNGNLVKDNARELELAEQDNIDDENNRHVSNYELQPILDGISRMSGTQPYETETLKGKLITTENAKALYPKIKITNTDYGKTNLFVHNKNILVNTAASKEIDGLTITQNPDRSITLDGEAKGKNLFSLDNLALSIGNTGIDVIDKNNFVLNGTASYSAIIVLIGRVSDLIGKSLYAYMNFVRTDYTINAASERFILCDIDGGNRSDIGNKFVFVDNDNIHGGVTIDNSMDNTKYVGIRLYATASGYPNQVTYTNVQVEFGNSATQYEPYKSTITYDLSKTSSNTTPIFTFKNNVNYFLSGTTKKQLFDINGTTSAGTLIKYNNGFTLIKTTNRQIRFDLPEVLEAGTYTLSYDLVSSFTRETNFFNMSLNKKNGSSYDGVLNNIAINRKSQYSFDAPSQFDALYFAIPSGVSDNTNITIDNVLLISGSHKTSSFEIYNNTGTDNTLIYNGLDGNIKYTDNEPVTYVALKIPTNTQFDNLTLKPQLELGTEATEYVTAVSNNAVIDFSQYLTEALLANNDVYPSDTLYPSGSNVDYILIEDTNTLISFDNMYLYLDPVYLGLYDGFNIIYAGSEEDLEVTYSIDTDFVTEEQLGLALSQMVGNDEIIAKLNLAIENGEGIVEIVGNKVIIDSDKFDLAADGTVKITNGVDTNYEFSLTDVNMLLDYLNGYINLPEDLRKLYEVTNNGTLDIVDAVRMMRIINGDATASNDTSYTADVVIDATKPQETMKLTLNNADEFATKIGINRVFAYSLEGKRLFIGNYIPNNNSVYADGTSINEHRIVIQDYNDQSHKTIITNLGITTPTVTQTSLEELKKNISKFKGNALEMVKNGDIYEYNFKGETDTHKKHIGFVIGDKYNTPDEVISESKEGIDPYSMTAILWKAVQEQQKQIEELKQEIKKLKGGK